MQFVKVFLGPGWGVNSIQIICCVYLYGVHVWPVMMCVSPVQNCCYKTKESKILLCCLTWHTVRSMSMYEQLIKYEIVVCTCSCMCKFVCLFADCEGQSTETHWRCYRTWDTSSCRCWSYGDASVWVRTQRGTERMPVVVSYSHAWQGNKMGVMSSWQYYGQIWGGCVFLPLQLSSNSRLIGIKWEVCFLCP